MDSQATRLFSSLTTAYQARDATIRTRLEMYLRQQWPTESWRDADLTAFAATVRPVVDAAAGSVATLTNAYLATVAKMVFKAQVITAKPPAVTTTDLRGVDADTVWARPAVTVWTALAAGAAIDAAQQQGLQRALSIAATNLQLAKTTTARARWAKDDGVVGFRRTLTGRENCALCVIASTQRYHKADLLPIHPGCDCTVAEIRGAGDPGQVINADLLESTQATITAQEGHFDTEAAKAGLVDDRALYKNLIVTSEHGEYGPTLRWRDHHFTGKKAVN